MVAPRMQAFRGRNSERQVLDQLLETVRAGQSAVLVVCGEAGVGKTALLRYCARQASGFRVAQIAGIESEMELAYAGLHQLCTPMLDHLDALPEPQRHAVRVAFGLSTGDAPDRFLIALAVLSLFAEIAAERPLLCLVDDAQWLDRISAQTLAFVARRLLAESVALVFGRREPSEDSEFSELPELAVGGLSDDDAHALLASVIQAPLDERVRDRVLAETRGNPLALLEMTRGLSPEQIAGGFGLTDTMPLAERIQESFVRHLQPLPPQTRQLLLTAAAEPVGDATLLWSAAERLGIGPDAATAAMASGLIQVGARVRFRHPLVRSAAYQSASPQERQNVHRALAEVTDPELDPDRRAWHRAHGTSGPDEDVAAELERSADRARDRGGAAAAAAFLARAAELTPDPARRGARALAAAQNKRSVAAYETSLELLGTAELCPLDTFQRVQVDLLRAQLMLALRRAVLPVPPLLFDAARRLEPLDLKLARHTYLEVLGAVFFAGRLGDDRQTQEAAAAARLAPSGPKPPRASGLLLEGLAARFADGYATSLVPLTRALDAFVHERGLDELRWIWLAPPLAPEVWNDEIWHQLTIAAIRFARETGALSVLPLALNYRAAAHISAGEFAAASASIEEADAIKDATRNRPLLYISMVLAAWRGQEGRTSELADAASREAMTSGEGLAIGVAEYARAVLNNGLGRYSAASGAAEKACEYEDPGLIGWALAELLEASTRAGNRDTASAALQRLQERTSVSGTDWALGIDARSRALLAEGLDADGLYREAIQRLSRTRIRVELARARLLYGEWLRRANRRADARKQLREAHDMFSSMGADGFADRARRELLATGEKVRKRRDDTRSDLTPQEEHIARLARDGRTNSEIGAALFISARTVEWHLRKVFTKLGISSRKGLDAALPRARDAAPA
jgi:DNA-binding CsgD family transcriptional regulator